MILFTTLWFGLWTGLGFALFCRFCGQKSAFVHKRRAGMLAVCDEECQTNDP